MRGDNIVQLKSFAFAIRIVNLYRFLISDKKEYVLSRQLLRTGTSIGANIEEAIGGQSNRDFIAKVSISYKEARETIYWIKLLHATAYLSDQEASGLLTDAEELCKILAKILITHKSHMNNDSKS